MKILYIDLKLQYLNPTRQLIPNILSKIATLKIFGPGFVSRDTLSLGINSFIKKKGPFDLILMSELVFFLQITDIKLLKQGLRRNYWFDFDINDVDFLEKDLTLLEKIELPKGSFFLESDYFNFTQQQIDLVEKNLDFFIGWNQQFVEKIENLPHLESETFFPKPNNNWRNLCLRVPEKNIPLLHFTGDSELNYSSIDFRDKFWCVPGVEYDLRKKAKRALEKAGIKVSGKHLNIGGLLQKIRLNPYSYRLFQNYLRWRFREDIIDSKFSYTCGSRLKYPIRKYFEIPALGSLLVCNPCCGFESIGFKNKYNAIECEPDEIPDLHEWLIKNQEEVQIIIQNGQRLIIDSHSTDARAKQLKIALDSILKDEWEGAEWVAGRFQPIRKKYSESSFL